MANPSKQKGTKAETAVVRYLDLRGVDAVRNVLHGSADEGDIRAEIEGLEYCFEVKNRKRIELAKWMGELSREKENAGADCGILVIKPEGTGLEKVGKWWVVMEFDEFRWGR